MCIIQKHKVFINRKYLLFIYLFIYSCHKHSTVKVWMFLLTTFLFTLFVVLFNKAYVDLKNQSVDKYKARRAFWEGFWSNFCPSPFVTNIKALIPLFVLHYCSQSWVFLVFFFFFLLQASHKLLQSTWPGISWSRPGLVVNAAVAQWYLHLTKKLYSLQHFRLYLSEHVLFGWD